MILPESAGVAGELVVREWRVEDAVALVAAVAASRDHLARWMAWAGAPPETVAERTERIRASERERLAGGDAVYGMFLGGRVVGGSGLHRRLGTDGLEIGYWVHVDFTGRGIATATAALLTDTAFGDDVITHVEIHHDAANAASGAVPRKLGFTLLGESPRSPTSPGEMGVECCWRMPRTQWLRVRPGAATG